MAAMRYFCLYAGQPLAVDGRARSSEREKRVRIYYSVTIIIRDGMNCDLYVRAVVCSLSPLQGCFGPEAYSVCGDFLDFCIRESAVTCSSCVIAGRFLSSLFQRRHIGGADDTIALLEQWDEEEEVHSSVTSFVRYETEIEALSTGPKRPDRTSQSRPKQGSWYTSANDKRRGRCQGAKLVSD